MSAVVVVSTWALTAAKLVTIGATLLCLLLGLLILLGGLGPILKAIFLRLGPRYLKAPLKIDSISVGPRNLTVRGLEIGSLEGFESPQTVTWKTLTVTVHQYRPAPVLLTVELQGYDVTYEAGAEKSNLQTLAANVSGPPAPPQEAEKQPAEPKPEKATASTVVLKRLSLTGGTTLVKSAGVKLELPDVEMTDLGAAEGGLKAEEVVPILFTLLLKTIFRGLANAGFTLAEGVLTDVSQTASNLLGGILSAVQSSPLPEGELKQDIADITEAQQPPRCSLRVPCQQGISEAVVEAAEELEDAKQATAKIEADLLQGAGTAQQATVEAQSQLAAAAQQAEAQVRAAAQEAERVKDELKRQADEVAKKFKSLF
eukprot:GGOE01043448.1.p1 GENE.GGOE01043448.1~~GGOE01043448.1.p1  ORF type:complete len:379 (-),score=129.26 GGOE01043448.1:334-1446(-)